MRGNVGDIACHVPPLPLTSTYCYHDDYRTFLF
jgi:hypothetical protein